MVVGAFPAAKLGLLAVRQVSKPLANIIKDEAKKSPVFRKYVCMPPAQFYNWVEVKTKMWALNLGKPVTVPPLNEAAAIELGANLLGEIVIFVIASGALLFEYTRQSSNEAKKQEVMRLEKIELTNTLSEMAFRLERQDAQLREMTRALGELESRNIFKWTKDRLSEYQPFDPSTPDQSARTPKAHEGVYSPDGGIAFRALNYLETSIYGDRGTKDSDKVDPTVGHLEDVERQVQTSLGHVAPPEQNQVVSSAHK